MGVAHTDALLGCTPGRFNQKVCFSSQGSQPAGRREAKRKNMPVSSCTTLSGSVCWPPGVLAYRAARTLNKEMQNALSGHNVGEGKDFKSMT